MASVPRTMDTLVTAGMHGAFSTSAARMRVAELQQMHPERTTDRKPREQKKIKSEAVVTRILCH